MKESPQNVDKTRLLTLFLCGDVMTGRGIDQVLPHPGNPQLYEAYIRDARDYVRLAERTNGAVKRPVELAYPWGDALANNHVLDWGVAGLQETLATLDMAGIRRAGAGRDLEEGMAPAVIPVPGKGRVLVFSCGFESSGIGRSWAAA
ncbi:MAG: CapA family protein, partial [Gammaproteobacteria bacterium]